MRSQLFYSMSHMYQIWVFSLNTKTDLHPYVRWTMGFDQLPSDRLGENKPLHSLHDCCTQQGVVRLQEQDLCGAAQSHEDRGMIS